MSSSHPPTLPDLDATRQAVRSPTGTKVHRPEGGGGITLNGASSSGRTTATKDARSEPPKPALALAQRPGDLSGRPDHHRTCARPPTTRAARP
jgi:hypothetical protein